MKLALEFPVWPGDLLGIIRHDNGKILWGPAMVISVTHPHACSEGDYQECSLLTPWACEKEEIIYSVIGGGSREQWVTFTRGV